MYESLVHSRYIWFKIFRKQIGKTSIADDAAQTDGEGPYTVTPSINTDLKRGSDMVNVVW